MKTGIDMFKENTDSVLKGRNIVLITGSSNVDGSGEPAYRIVKAVAGDRLKAVWSLQHGFFVDKQDNMILSDSFYWEPMDIRINSLYGDKLLPDPAWLEGVDALLIDVFDIGTRVYTFVNHLLMIMKSISGKAVDIIVLDRPNPLNGLHCEGNLMEPDYFSIVGQIPVPMRHSLTTAEFLSYGMNYLNIDLQLEIVMLKNWNRANFFQGLWTYPSPNMPTVETAIVYPGAVLLEGTNLSEGRGTTRPFHFVGAPFIDNFLLLKQLKHLEPQGAVISPVFFKPEFSKFSGEICNGISVLPTAPNSFESFQLYYEIIRIIARDYPQQFEWKKPPYEFEYERPPIDMICGGSSIREAIGKDKSYSQLKPAIDKEITSFKEKVADYILY